MEDLLTLIAELSVALAGFTAVFSVLDTGRSSDARETMLQIMRVKQMLIGAVTNVLACVVALALLRSPYDEALAWRVAGGGGLLAMLITIRMLSAEARSEKLFSAPGFSRIHANCIFTLIGISVVLLASSVVAADASCAPGLFAAAVITVFAFSAIQFARAAIKQFAAARSRSTEE